MAVRYTATGQQYTSTTVPGTTWTMCGFAYIAVDRNDFSCAFAIEDAAVSATRYYEIATAADGTTLSFETSGGSIAMGAMTVGTWYKIGVVAAAAAGTTYFGTMAGNPTQTTGSIDSTVVPNTMFFGTDSFGEWWNGRLAGVRVWNAALTQAEINLELTQLGAIRQPNLMHSRPFEVTEAKNYGGTAGNLSAGTGSTTEAGPPVPYELRGSVTVGPSLACRAVW